MQKTIYNEVLKQGTAYERKNKIAFSDDRGIAEKGNPCTTRTFDMAEGITFNIN